jgi:hypothetical protein
MDREATPRLSKEEQGLGDEMLSIGKVVICRALAKQ